MIDVKRLRSEPEAVKANLARRHIDLSEVDEAIKLDVALRDLIGKRDELRAQVKDISSQVGAARKAKDNDKADALMEESRELGEKESALAADADEIEKSLGDLLLVIPNLISDDVPDGKTDQDNPQIEIVDGFSEDGFAEYQRVPHWETGEALGILDLERGAKIAGSMFTVFRGSGATLSRALCQAALDRNADAYEEVRPPSLVRTTTLTATGHLPKFVDDAYEIGRDDLWAIPTSEVPLTSMAKDEILDESTLPMKMMAYSPCFRREAGSAGKDTRGLLRVHEFDKVELMAYTTAEQGPEVLNDILTRAKNFVKDLGLAYRVIEICSGDLGQGHHKSYDIEVYSPGVGMWLEVSSCSWYADYQARRANIRYKSGKNNVVAHTCNGSALAVPRIWAAIVETHRQANGTVQIPEVLHPYMRGITQLS